MATVVERPGPVENWGAAQGLLLDLDFVDEHWPDLIESSRPGTRRPWRQPLLDPERRAELAARDRDERANRDPDAPGFTAAPVHLDVLAAAVELWLIVHELTEAIATRTLRSYVPGRDRDERQLASNLLLPELQLRRLDELPGMTAFVRAWLDHAVTEWDVDVTDPARRLARSCREVQRLLSLVRGGQLLARAVCPWCGGVTAKHPAGGAATLRVEEIVSARPAKDGRPARDAVFAVVCWNPVCDPPDADCGKRWRNHPAWPSWEWDWLAPRLLKADPVVNAPSLLTLDAPRVFVTVDGEQVEVKPVVHSGRTGQIVGGRS